MEQSVNENICRPPFSAFHHQFQQLCEISASAKAVSPQNSAESQETFLSSSLTQTSNLAISARRLLGNHSCHVCGVGPPWNDIPEGNFNNNVKVRDTHVLHSYSLAYELQSHRRLQ